MIYQDIKNSKNENATYLVNSLDYAQPVSTFEYGSNFAYLDNHSYANREINLYLLDCEKLLVDPDGNLYFINGDMINVVTPTECSLPDPEKINVKFIPKKERKEMQEKVVGTTFHDENKKPITYLDIAGETKQSETNPELDYKVGSALLMPDPENKYDSNAVAVIAKLNDGSAYKLGYLAKGSQLYEETTKPKLAKLLAYGYSKLGSYNDSYVVEV